MNKKIKKHIRTLLMLVLMIAIISSNTISASAATVTYYVDNDDAQGHSNTNYGSYSYMTASSLYYGDARYKPSAYTGSYGTYEWNFGSSVQLYKPTAQVRVYLYHGTFTDPAANYYLNSDVITVNQHRVGTINQNLAVAGWNTICSNYQLVGLTNGNVRCRYVNVCTSNRSSSYRTGADYVAVTLTG